MIKPFILFSAALALWGAGPARFAEHTIATDLTGGYQVVVADLNHDGKPDLIALASGMSEFVWYENPTWKRHLIAGGLSHMINCAFLDGGPGGTPEIVLASGFSMVPKESAGIVSVLRPKADPTEPWTITEIDRLSTSHRLRVAHPEGIAHPIVVNAPLANADAVAPDYRGENALVFYRPGTWKREYISRENQGLVHGILIVDWDGDGRDEVLTAGFEGVHLFKLAAGKWTRTELLKGDPAPWPKSGTSDISIGRLGKERFLAAIEPWHGNEVSIYRRNGNTWDRQVIDTSLVDGHTIQTADFDHDGNDEIISGFRGGSRSVYIYKYDPAAKKWNRSTLDDGGIAAAACAVADLNGDGRPDVACIGAATANLKWYENLGTAKP